MEVPQVPDEARPCVEALQKVLNAIEDSQRLAKEMRTAVESEPKGTTATTSAAEVAAFTQQLKALSTLARDAKLVLTTLKLEGRSCCKLALWTTFFFLVFPIAYAIVEIISEQGVRYPANSCNLWAGVTDFLFVSGLIWICCYIVRNKMLPLMFPRTHPAMTEARKQKTIGHVMKGLVRFLVFLQLISIGFLWTMDGLKLGFKTKTETITSLSITNGTCSRVNTTITTYDLCDGIHGTARRTWKVTQTEFMAIMAWELCYTPTLKWSIWVHHLTLIVGVSFITDFYLRGFILNEDSLASGSQAPPSQAAQSLDGFAYILILGTAFIFLKELAVVFFQHRHQSQYMQQYKFLLGGVVAHIVGQLVFYVVWPFVYIGFAVANGQLQLLPLGLIFIILLLALNGLELFILTSTISVMRYKRKQAMDKVNITELSESLFETEDVSLASTSLNLIKYGDNHNDD